MMRSARHLHFLCGLAVSLLLLLLATLQAVTYSPQAESTFKRSTIQRGSLPYSAQISIDDKPIIDLPLAHLGGEQISQDGRYVAVPVLPSGSETLSVGTIYVVDIANKRVIARQPGYAVAWLDNPSSKQNLLTIDKILFKQSGKPTTRSGQDQAVPQDTYLASRSIFALLNADAPISTTLQHINTEPLLLPEAFYNKTGLAQQSPAKIASSTYPDTIRVRHHEDNRCRNLLPGDVSIIPFEAYVARVLSSEVPSTWSIEALKAQAVAIRTYAWHQIQRQRKTFDVTDWADYQYMCDTIYERSQQAASATAGIYLTAIDDLDRQPLLAMYSAENSHPTKTSLSDSHLQSVPDLYSLGRERFGHGYGLSQWGAQRRAVDGHRFLQILGHYYTNVNVRNALSPTIPLADFIQPLSHELSSASIRWQTITSPLEDINSDSLNQTVVDPSGENTGLTIQISTSRPLTYYEEITVTEHITHVAIMTGTDGLTETVLLTDTILVTETRITTPQIQFSSTHGVWPLPPQFIDGDKITLTLGINNRRLYSSAHEINTNLISPPAIVDIGGSTPISTEVSAIDVISDIQTTVVGTSAFSAAVGISLDWIWQGEELYQRYHQENSGKVVADPLADQGQSWQADSGQDQQGIWYGPYTQVLPEDKSYRAIFWLKTTLPNQATEPYSTLWADQTIARLDVTDNLGEALLGLRDINYGDFQRQTLLGGYTPVAVDFHIFEPLKGLEFRVDWKANTTLALDYVQIWTLPEASADGQFQAELFLGLGYGERTLTVAGFDNAGNVSQSISRTVKAVDLMSPSLQQVIIPTSVISGTAFTITVQTIDRFSGLDSSAALLTINNKLGTIQTGPALQVLENPWVSQMVTFTLENGLAEGTYEAQVSVQDRAGNRIQSSLQQIDVRSAPMEPIFRQYIPIFN